MSLRPAIRLQQDRGSVIVTVPATEPVTAAELRAHLVETTDSLPDATANALIAEARQEIEDQTGMAFITQSWRLSLDDWPSGADPWWDGVRQMAVSELAGARRTLQLPRYPLQSITSVTVYDDAGDDTAVVVATTFDVDTYRKPGRMTLRTGATWPIALRQSNAIQVIYVAGYGAAIDVPAPIKRAIKQMAAYIWTHKGDACDAGDAYLESGAAAIMAKYRVQRL